MSYIENIYVCLAAPVLLALLFGGRDSRKQILFLFLGMTSCLLSSYVSTFLAAALGMDAVTATIELTPVVEETMKLLPMLFYLLVYEPKREDAERVLLFCVIGFATFENVCYLTQNGAASLELLLIRGFGTGSMHVFSGVVAGVGFLYLWYVPWMKAAGTLAMLCVAVIFHALYNLFVNVGGTVARIAYFAPVVTLLLSALLIRPALRKLRENRA